MEKLRNGSYVFKMEIPITVHYSKRGDGSVSIDIVTAPSEDEIYEMVDENAKQIKAGAELRM